MTNLVAIAAPKQPRLPMSNDRFLSFREAPLGRSESIEFAVLSLET
jgi:hypothetical protein